MKQWGKEQQFNIILYTICSAIQLLILAYKKLFAMKTVLLNTSVIKSNHNKIQPLSHRTRAISNNIRNIKIDDISRIQGFLTNQKLRQTTNIFFINLKPKNKINYGSKSQTLQPKRQQKNSDRLSEKRCQLPFIEIASATNQKKKAIYNSQLFQKMESGNILKQYRKNKLKATMRLREYDNCQKTHYFYKKQSLMSELQFLKADNRYHQVENPELEGIQKTVYFRPKVVHSEKRSISVKSNPKNQNSTHLSECSEVHSSNLLNSNKNNNQDELIKRKRQQQFTPWALGETQHEHQAKVQLYTQHQSQQKQ